MYSSSDDLPTFSNFKEFLTSRYRALEFLETKSVNRVSNNNNVSSGKPNVFHVTASPCQFCSQDHKLGFCKKFAKEDTNSRREFVQKNGLCFNCFSSNHSAKFCQSASTCRVCKRRHHSLLHPKVNNGNNMSGPVSSGTNQASNATEDSAAHSSAAASGSSSSVVACFTKGTTQTQVLLATTLVEVESKTGKCYTLRALLDQGSQASFVTEATVQYLGLNKIPINGFISGLGEGKRLISNYKVVLKITSQMDPTITINIIAYVLKSITSFLPERKISDLEWLKSDDIVLADPQYHTPNKIDLLLGADVYGQVIRDGVKRGPEGSPVAQFTSFGWIISGNVYNSNIIKSFVTTLDEDEQLKKFWEIEADTQQVNKIMTEEEKRCEEFVSSTIRRDLEGRYIVRLPFKDDDPECKRGQSREIAEKRLKSLEYKLNKNQDLKERYNEVIREYLQLGHMELVPKSEIETRNAVYLPHHAVVREDKDTTKVRVVFDASCKGNNNVSLNDNLMVGPTLQPDLRNILMRWRTHPFCLVADIVKMYRQIIVDKRDTDYQRILWRDETSDKELKDYRLLRVTFGTASAPYLAVKCLQQIAFDDGKEYPETAKIILSDFYMDDLMTGCQSINEGRKLHEEISNLLKRSGFQLQKWSSNNDDLLDHINKCEENKQYDTDLKIKLDTTLKILGLTWNRRTDAFHYAVNLPDVQEPVTKRKILSDISRLFDPLGWVAPSIILAKIMIQKLWLAGIKWDEEISKDLLTEWMKYRNELPLLSKFQIPRWLNTIEDNRHVELHGFCDASKLAYAAVVYIRVVDPTGNIKVTLLTAKSKVAPIKQISIPRLELCGAVLLTRLLCETGKILGISKDKSHAWTDSTVVLSWINSHPSRWKTFVANRVSEILTSLEPNQWSYVPSKQNAADCASRGILPAELLKNSLWLEGPEFLKKDVIQFDKPKDNITNLDEVIKVHAVTEYESPWYDRFSSWNRLVRVTAYCRRFMNVIKSVNKQRNQKHLSLEEIKIAANTCIRKCQELEFCEEIKILKQSNPVFTKKHKFRSLNPYIDENEILRVGGRLEAAEIDNDLKHPILLPQKSHLTNLIIADAHLKTLHGGPQLMLTFLRAQYWIIGGKNLVKNYCRKCVICIRYSAKTKNPLMGQLPSARVTPAKAFQNCGVDYAGPIQIRSAKGRGQHSSKGYICLFICMATRAVHLEAVSDLTTQAFLAAFKRLVARRGRCSNVWSDNGTNFVGASKEIQHLFKAEKNSMITEVAEILATNGTRWHFMPPHSPNFGGLWEAGVKSTKRHLVRLIGNSTLTYEELATLLAQIEACLNSRPLSIAQETPENYEVLTPGHFLVTEPLVTAPDYNYETVQISSLRRWQLIQKLMQNFWHRWSQEYLVSLLHRYKWQNNIPEPKIGDIALIKEDDLPPCRWLFGKIVEKHSGNDKITRVVSLQTKKSVIKRPVSKICILPVTK